MSDQKKESELNSSNCYLIKYWHYTVWAKIRSGLKDAEPDNSSHAHWHFVVVSLQRLSWGFERLPKFCENWNNFYQLSVGTGSVWQTAFSLITVNFETEIVQHVGPLQKSNTNIEQINRFKSISHEVRMCVWQLLALGAYTQLQVHTKYI